MNGIKFRPRKLFRHFFGLGRLALRRRSVGVAREDQPRRGEEQGDQDGDEAA